MQLTPFVLMNQSFKKKSLGRFSNHYLAINKKLLKSILYCKIYYAK